MSQILKGLRKIQESRQNHQDSKVVGIAYLENATRAWPKTAWMIIPVGSATVAILISILAIMLIMTNRESEQIKVHILEKTIQIQEIKINDLVILFNKTRSSSDSEVRDLAFRFKKENQNMKDQIGSLASAFKDTYKFMLLNRSNTVTPAVLHR